MGFDPVENIGTLRAIFDSLPYAFYVINDRLEIEWTNQRAADTREGRRGSKNGRSYCYEAVLQRDDACHDCPTLRAFRSGRPESLEIGHPGGDEHRRLLVTSAPLTKRRGRGRPLVVEMVQHIGESKEVGEQLRRISELNSAIIEHAPVAIFTIDTNGKFLSVNPALATLSGLGCQASAKLINFNWLENPYTIKCGLADYIKKGLTGEPFELWDFPFVTYRGDKSQYIHFGGVPLRAKDGNVEGLLCIIEETTERVRISAQLMQEGKMSAIGRLAAAIAHELNNPLATLVVHSELACDLMQGAATEMTKTHLEELRGYMEVVEKQAFRCKEIIKDLFDLLWREGPEEGSTDVNSLLNELVEGKDFGREEIALTRTFCPDLPPVKGDQNALRQVFTNIIQNALDAMEAQTRGEIGIRTSLADHRVLIEIEDNGVGIPEAIVRHIFEPFFTTKRSSKGMGLGLTICHDLVKKMGGTIEVERGQAGGSLFRVSIPASGNRE